MQTYQVTFRFSYTENIIPPRCRKPRPQQFEGQYTVEIPALSDKETPVAIIETDRAAAPQVLGGERRTRVRQYRWYNNHLWCDHQIDRFKDIEFEPIQPIITGYGCSYQSLAQHQEQAHLWAKSKILVDGIVHQPLRGEPRLLVNRDYFNNKFYVSLERHFDYDVPRFRFSDFYRIDQINEAIAKCHHWFERFQNDGDEVELVIPYEYEILIPQAIQLNPQFDQSVADEEKFQTNLQKLISQTKSLFPDSALACRALKETLASLQE